MINLFRPHKLVYIIVMLWSINYSLRTAYWIINKNLDILDRQSEATMVSEIKNWLIRKCQSQARWASLATWNVHSSIIRILSKGGGDKRILEVKHDFKERAKPKVGSKDNMTYTPGKISLKRFQNSKLNLLTFSFSQAVETSRYVIEIPPTKAWNNSKQLFIA